MKTNSLNNRSSYFATLALACVAIFSFGAPYVKAANFSSGNLAVVVAASATNNNTTASVIELSPSTASQSAPVQTISIDGNSYRVSASATSTLYLANSADGSLVALTAQKGNSTTSASNANTLTSRGVVTINNAATVANPASWTGTSGQQTRGASSLNNSTWFIGDQNGLYTDGATTASPSGNFRGVKSFGSVVYAMTSSTAAPFVGIISAATGGTYTALTGLPNGTTAGQDFYLIQSGSNGTTYDVLYILSATSATAGTIAKYSLVSGSWTANGTYATTFGGFGLAGKKSGSGADLFVTSGTGATAANVLYKLTDTAGFNASIAITTANNVSLYTTAAGTTMKGVAFAPVVAAATATITGATTATAFTTTYGTVSTAQTFAVGGSNLSASITATAPTGFEVSSDGTTYGATATFTQSGGTATGSLRVRLAATATPGTSYDSKNVVLSSTGASSVNIVTASTGNTVSKKALTITGLTGTSKDYTGTTSASVTGTAALSGFVGSDTATLDSSSASWTYATATVGTAKTITASAYAISGGQSSYYTLTQPTSTADINARSLTITASNVTKAAGAVLTGGSGSTAFTSSGLQNSETIGSVTITYGSGAAAEATGGVYADAVVPSAATGGTFTASNYLISYTAGSITVNASPTTTATGTLAAVGTIYGTASASPTSFTVSGGNLTGDLSVAAPSGFEISTSSGSGYAGSLYLAQSGGSVSSTTIYVRLAATTGAGTYSGNVTITGGGATAQNVATASSTVATKALTITGLSGVNKVYDASNTAGTSGTAAYVGLVNGDSFTVTGNPTATFADANVGTAKVVSVTGITAPSLNYSVTQPVLSADITQKPLTVENAAVTTKSYNATTAAVITGTLTGVLGSDAVTFNGTGTFADVNAGTGIAVTSTSSISGARSANYSLTQPMGLTGDITKANQSITFGALASKTTADAPFALSATANSGLTVSYSSSNTGVATVAGSTVTLVGVGTTTITASQAGDSNYNAAASVNQTLTVTVGPTTLATGDIAVIGYNSAGTPDSFTILVLKDLNPGTIFYVNDNETASGGTSFNDLAEGEASFTVKAGKTIVAGTVITLPWGGAAVSDSTVGYDWSATSSFGLGNNNEEIFIYTASSITSTTPTAFIYGVGIGTSSQAAPSSLILGRTFIKPTGLAARYKTSGAVYAGPAETLLPAIGITANNWETTAPGAVTDWTFNTQYLLPVVTSLSPSSVAPGGVDFPLTIIGSNFYTTSQVTLAGVSKTVTYVNGGQLTIPVTASEIAAVGRLEVVVTNPAPGGGSSAGVNLGVNYAPSLALTSPIDNSIYNSTIQTPTASRNFIVSGSNLTSGITVTAPAGFEVSSDNSTYQSSLLLPQSGGAVVETTLYVRFNPIGVQSYGGRITVATDGVTPSPGFDVQGIASVPNNGTLAAAFADNRVALTGAAATGMVAEYIVLAQEGSPITASLMGSGDSLTASTVYGQGSPVGSAFVVYKGNEAPTALQVTGLTNRLRYFFALYSRVGSSYSTGFPINGMPFATLGNVITQWDFNGVNTPVLGSGQLSTSGTVTVGTYASGLGSSDLTTGNNQGVTTTSYPAQGVNPETSGPVCAVSTVGKKDIIVYWDLRQSNTSSRYTRFQYSTDGGVTWTNYQATGDLTEGGLYVGNYGDTWFLQRKADLSAISAVNNNANFAFRIVTAYAPNTSTYVAAATGSAYGSSGTLRYDMLTVTGVDGVFNSAPTDVSLSSASIAENNAVIAIIGTLTTTDADSSDTHTYSLVTGTGDTDNASFNISGNSLRASAPFDFEAKSSYSVRVRSTDAGGLFTEKQFAVAVTDVNEAPSVTSAEVASAAENQTAVQTVTGTDPDAGATLSYRISGGVDSTKFVIDSKTGVLTFVSAPDFEIPTDFGTNNVYDVIVEVSDGTLTATKAVAVSVLDVVEIPSGFSYTPAMISGTVGTSIANLTPAITGTQITYAVDPALPAGLSIDPTTGVISGKPTAPAVSALYTVTATNTAGNTTTQIAVAVVAPGSTYGGWLNGVAPSDAAFWDYVYGATAPGQLPASLKPTTAITGGNLVLTYYVRQNTIGLTVTAKKSLDLATGPSGWNTDKVTDVAVGAPTTVNGVTVQQRTASVLVDGAKKFLRLEGFQAQ